jgi:hypothetical protein
VINIRLDSWFFIDQNFTKLVLKTGCQFKATGLLIHAWILAQKYWVEFNAIPLEHWPKELDILIETGFIEQKDDNFLYLKRSKEQLSWLGQRSKAGKTIKNKTSNAINAIRETKANETKRNRTKSNEIVTGPIESLFGQPETDALLEMVPQSTQKNWLELYSNETAFIKRELIKHIEWCKLNPKKVAISQKGKVRQINYWLEKAFRDYQRNIPKAAPKTNIEALLKERQKYEL